MEGLDGYAIAAVFAALAIGGLLKGATGMGTPVVAVPVMAGFVDVRLAVVVMVLPNLFSNLWQLFTYRKAMLPGPFPMRYALAGAAGAVIGTGLLAVLSSELLKGLVAGAVLLYIALRLARPGFCLAHGTALRYCIPVGVTAGVLQGAAGVSAPVSVSYLNAMRLPRQTFVPTVSLFFMAMSVVQVPALFAMGLWSIEAIGLSMAAMIPLALAIPVGSLIARSISAETFDRITLALLFLMASKLIFDTV